MPATWPVGVPFKLLRSGAGVTPGETAVRGETDSGFARQRAAFTAALDVWTGTIRMTWAQWETFAAWRKALGGAAFTWLGHPSGAAKVARFVAGQQGAATADTQTAKYLVPVAIEILPG